MLHNNILKDKEMPNVILLLLLLLSLSGCQTQKATEHTWMRGQPDHSLEEALNARGFTFSKNSNINYLDEKRCSNFELQAHRGSVRYPENSMLSIADALDNDFDVIETDVQLTSDSVWVVHHDAYTGRETGTVDNKRRKISHTNYEYEWSKLRHRNMKTGVLIDTVPPSFRTIAYVFNKYAKPYQKLNIEIKGRVHQSDLEMLDYLAFAIIGQGSYFYSSLELDNLQKMRQINENVYLSFIQEPAKESINLLVEGLKNAAGSDPIYLRNEEYLVKAQKTVTRFYRENRYDSVQGLKIIQKSLKDNYGMALDIRHYVQSGARFKRIASTKNINLATYTINSQEYHQKELLRLKESLRPDSVIIDASVYSFCSQFYIPEMKEYNGSTDLTRKIAQLPKDLDLSRLEEIDEYWDGGLYISVNGKVKSYRQTMQSNERSYPALLSPQAGPRDTKSPVNIDSRSPIKIKIN